jgi:transposase InsO family protein
MSTSAQPPLPFGPPPHVPPPPPDTSGGTASQSSSAPVVANNNSLSVSTSSPKIEKLRDGNWLAWKTRIATILETKEALEVATGITPQPQDPAASAIWKSKDLIARTLITTAVKDEQIIHISNCSTAAEMWNALRVTHEPRGQQSILSLRRALYSTQADEGADIPAHLNEIKSLRDRLSLSGHKTDDNDFKSILVASLPRSWESFSSSYLGYQGSTLGNQNAQTMTSAELTSLLCEEDKRRKEKEAKGEYAYTTKAGYNAQKGKRPCAICERTNHKTADCRHKGKPKCNVCSRFGHRADECWKNPANKGKGRITKHKENRASSSKEKERAQVAKEDDDDTDSDTAELPKAFASSVTIDENKNGEDAEFSVYSWIADSGATTHIYAHQSAFIEFAPIPKKEIQGLGNKPVSTYGRGTVLLTSRIDKRVTKIRLNDTLYVPEARENLISLGRIDSVRGKSVCANGKIHIYDSDRRTIATGTRKNNLYYIDVITDNEQEQANLALKMKYTYTWEEWHRRLGHISISGLRHLHAKHLVDGMSIRDSPQDFECESCIQAKLTCAPLPKTVSRREREPGELTHTDVWGPARVPSIHGYRYYISFVDDATRQVILYYMKTKDEASEKVKHYLTYIERQGQKCPKAVRADNGREYVNKDLIGWCHSKGIELQTTAPHTPEQNGVAERWNRTVVELGRAMIIARKLPSELWPEAMSYATYIRNRAYTRAVPDMTPYQKWLGKRPDITHIQEFGRDIWVLDEQINPSKLEPNAHKYKFVGYEEGPRAIKYYDAQKKTLKVSCNFRFPQSIVNPNAASRSRFEGEMRDNKKQSESSSSNKLPPDTAQEEASTNNKRKTTDGDDDSKFTRRKLNDETHCPNDEIPELDDDPDEDEHETSSAAHVYKVFSDSTLGKDPKT